jgi:hypothetical protein
MNPVQGSFVNTMAAGMAILVGIFRDANFPRKVRLHQCNRTSLV